MEFKTQNAQIIAREVTYLTMNRVIWDEIISSTPMAENGILGRLRSKTTTPRQQHIIQQPISKKDGTTLLRRKRKRFYTHLSHPFFVEKKAKVLG